MEYSLTDMNEMNHGLKEMNEMDHGLKEINDTMTKADVMRGLAMKSWWNLSVMKSITEQRDDQNPNLQSIFSLGYQWCWSSKAIRLTPAPTLNGNPAIIIKVLTPFLFHHKTATLTSVRGYTLRNVYPSISGNIPSYTLHVNHLQQQHSTQQHNKRKCLYTFDLSRVCLFTGLWRFIC